MKYYFAISFLTQCMMAEPCRLPAGITADGTGRCQSGLLHAALPFQHLPQLRHTMCPHGREAGRQLLFPQGRHFFQCSCSHHIIKTLGNGRPQFIPGRVKLKGNEAVRCRWQGPVFLPRGKPPACPHKNLPRTAYSLGILLMKPGSCLRIRLHQLSVQGLRANIRQQSAGLLPGLITGIRYFHKTIRQGTKIHARPTTEDRQPPCLTAGLHFYQNLLPPPCHAPRCGRWQDPVKTMGNGSFLLLTGTGRKDTQLSVNLHGISIDDRTTIQVCQMKSQSRLARTGRSRHNEGVFRRVHILILPYLLIF